MSLIAKSGPPELVLKAMCLHIGSGIGTPMRPKTRFYFCIILDNSFHHSWFKRWHLEHQVDFVHVLFPATVLIDVDGCFTSISSTRVVLQVPPQKKKHRQENKMKVPSRILASSEYIPSACLKISTAGECAPGSGRPGNKQDLGEEMWPLVKAMAFYWTVM